MIVLKKIHKLIAWPVYYFFHKNLIFGYLFRFFSDYFYYKKFKFFIKDLKLPVSLHSSFLFKTYELNDRWIVEKYINKKNKCIVIGGGLGFIACLAYNLSKNLILVFETNSEIIKKLDLNLKINLCNYKIFNQNLVFENYKKYSNFYFGDNFLNSSKYRADKKIVKTKNIFYKKIKNFKKFNTLIIDGEGIEEYFVKNIKKLSNINYLIFELHYNIISEQKIKKMFLLLKRNNFYLKESFFNSYYFKRND